MSRQQMDKRRRTLRYEKAVRYIFIGTTVQWSDGAMVLPH